MSFKPLAFITRYINPSPDSEARAATYIFPKLRVLEIHYGYIDSPTQELKVFNENMRFLLKTLHCPKLRSFRVLPEPNLLRKLLSGHKVTISRMTVRKARKPVQIHKIPKFTGTGP